jgi:FKBP-type peptidyl-prolyl cis-trans isomerase SlpA
VNSIGIGSAVTLHYTLALSDGTPVDTSLSDTPLSFTMGDGTLVHGLELALYGLKPGDHQQILIGAGDAWGMPEVDRAESLPRSAFSTELALDAGAVVEFEADGEPLLGTVVSADAEGVRVDFNHPLAGHDIRFEVWILEVGVTTPEPV